MFDLSRYYNGTVTIDQFDADELKKQIAEKTEPYTKLVVTADTLKDAKDIRASLNKEKTALDTERKEVEKEYKKPLTEFTNKVKEVLGLYDAAIANIDKQTKAIDEERIKKKQEHLHKLYDENIGIYAEFLPFEKVKRPQWDNATYKDIDILHDISGDKTKIMGDLDVLKALDSEIYDELIKKYKASGNDLATAIKANQDYIQAKQLAEKRIAEEKAEEDFRVTLEAKPAVTTTIEEPKKHYATFTVRVDTEEEANELQQFLDFNDITAYSIVY